MFRTFLLIFSFCGLTAVSVVLEYKASAEAYECPPSSVCLPEAPLRCETLPNGFFCVQPPKCEMPVCEVSVPHPSQDIRHISAHWAQTLMCTPKQKPSWARGLKLDEKTEN